MIDINNFKKYDHIGIQKTPIGNANNTGLFPCGRNTQALKVARSRETGVTLKMGILIPSTPISPPGELICNDDARP